MKNSLPFQLITPIGGYDVLVTGIGYWNDKYQQDWDNNDCSLEDIASYDIEHVSIGTDAYKCDKAIQGDLSYQIDKATLAHMEYLFSEYCAVRYRAELDYTDYNQDK